MLLVIMMWLILNASLGMSKVTLHERDSLICILSLTPMRANLKVGIDLFTEE